MTATDHGTADRSVKFRRLLRTTALASCLVAAPAFAQNLPVPMVPGNFGGAVKTNLPGNAGFSLDLQDANRVINWASFDVAANRTVDFTTAANTPFAVLNRVTLPNPSDILGTITSKSNVTVWLVNPSGITFGNTGSFSGGSLILSTAQQNILSIPAFDAAFIAGNAPLTLTDHSNAAIVLNAGSGALQAAGPILVIAQTIIAGKTMGSAGGDVALVAAREVVVPSAFGSPLGIAITQGTTLATARIDANGAIDAANVRLYGARDSDVTDALLNVGSAAVLTASAVNGKVVLAAGTAAAGTDLSFAGAAAGDIDGVANIAQAGTLRATGANGDVLLATNGAIGGGGDLSATLGRVTLIAPLDRDIVVGDIAAADNFSLATQANITTGAIAVSGGFIELATTGATGGFIQTGALAASNRITVDAATAATIGSAAASATADVTIDATDDIALGGASGRDILLTSVAGDIDVTADLVAGRTVTIDAAQTATVGRGVTAATGNYTVDGAAVVLGTNDATPVVQQAGRFVEITADATSISGIGALTLRSDRDGAGGARYLQLSAATDIDFADSTLLAGGPANQSVLALLAGSTIRLGSVAARRIVPVADFSQPFSTTGDFAATDITVADDLSITSTTGSIRIGQATSQTGDIALTATAGDVTGLAGSADAGPLDPGFGQANLTASAANRRIVITASGNAQLGTLTAGDGPGVLNALQIDIGGDALSLVRAVAANGNARVVASGGAATLGSADVQGDLRVVAAAGAIVSGEVSAGNSYLVQGESVTLGDGSGVTQAAGGSVDITATAGPVTGNAGLVLQSNSGGQADAGDARFLRLTATGDVLDFAPTSRLLAGTTGQSVLALNGDATAIDLGIVRARTLTASDLAATGFVTAGDFTAVDAITRGNFDVTSTAGSIRIGTATSQTGNIALTTTNGSAATGDITGVATGGGFGRAILTASAANATIAVRAINAAHLVQLDTVTAGSGNGSVALDQITLEGGVLDVAQAIARNGGLLAQSTTGDVILGSGSSARLGATIAAQDNARLGGLTSIAGLVDVRTTTGDVTGLASGGGFGRGNLTASGSGESVFVISAGAVTLDTLTAGQDVVVRAGSAITPSDGAIDLTRVTATNGDFTLDAFSANLAAPLRNGGVLLGIGSAGRDGTIAASGDVTLTNATIGRDLAVSAGIVGISTDSAAIVDGTIVAGTTDPTGSYSVTASRVDLGGTQSAAGFVDIFAYGAGAGDGITGQGNLTLTANRNNGAADAPLLLRADGGAGIAFAANSTLLGGTDGISADIGIFDPLASLTLGVVRARSVQGLSAITPDFGSLTAPNTVNVTGDVDLTSEIAVRGGLSIVSQTGDITTRAITVGTAANGDRSLTLNAIGGSITANETLLAFGDVTLEAFRDIRIAGITTSPLPSANPTLGDISITSIQGDVTGLADTLSALAPFGIGTLDALNGGVALNLPGNAAIGTIDARGLIDLNGSDIRLDRATSRNGAIDITASGALTGTRTGFAGVGNVSADLDARGSIRIAAGGAGQPRAVNLRDLTAGADITVEANRIALASATATTGDLTLIAGATLALGSGIAGGSIAISGTGGTGAPAIDPDFAAGVLDTNFGSTDLFADADGQTIRIAAGTIAQLDEVRAGTLASTDGFRQIDISAGALTVQSLTARNGDIFASTGPGIAPTIGSPLYVGTISTTNGVELRKTGDTGLSQDELRVGSIASAQGDIFLFSDASARLGPLVATSGSVSAQALGDLTGVILPAPTGSAPRPAFALLDVTADRDIALDAGRDLQTGTLTAGRDIDATATAIAWIGGTTTASTGHYRVTGGTVLLGEPGNVVQTAASDVAIRSTTGAITGGSGLLLTSDSGNTGNANSYLVLDSAGAITFANGLNGDTIATLRGGTNGTSADIGIRLAPNRTLQLGNVVARTVGSATGPSGAPALYTIAPVLTTRGAISANDITVANDLAIDNVTSGFGITLDTARAIGGGINIATAGDFTGREIDPVLAPGVFARIDLTAALGIETRSGGALFGTIDAGTGVQLTTGSGSLDATEVIARAGDLVLASASHIRVNTVTASGDGVGAASAQMLASAILPSATLTTAGDIAAIAARDVTDTALGGSATFVSTTGGVNIVSTATAAGDGVILADLVSANGTTSGHRDASVTGRRIAIGTLAESTGGDATLAATEIGTAQRDVSVTAPLVTALRNVTISAGFGSAANPGADNGSIRVGSIAATTGSITLAALDGDITGRSGTTDGLDPLHDRTMLTAGGAIVARSGGLTSIDVATGTTVRIEAGDVTQAGARADNGAIDITRIATSGDLTLIARAATATGGFTGDVRLGATAAGQPAGIAATTAGGTALLETRGVRGDVIVASALVTTGDLTLRSAANARLAGGDATPFATQFLESTDGDIAITAGIDVTGLRIPGTSGGNVANFGRADLRTGGAGTITLTAGGTLRLGTVTAGTIGLPDIADQITATAQAIDLTTATANNGSLALTSTLGDIRLDTGDAQVGATIDAAANARLGTLLTRSGNIQAIARDGDVTGLPDAAGFARSDLTAQGTGTITVDAANGTALLGPVLAGTVGTSTPADQIVVTAQAIDITDATANNGNLALTSTLGDVRIETGVAQVGATIAAAGNARIGTLATQTGNIVVTTGADVTGLADGAEFTRADLATGATGTITLTATTGALLLGTVTAGTLGQPDVGDQITATARAIDITTATANNGNSSFTSTLGDVRIETGASRGDTTIAAAGSARIGVVTTRTGDIAITAGTDVSGLRIAGVTETDLANFGRADLATGGIGTITLTAGGALQIDSAIAGSTGQPDIGDQITATAQAIDITTAVANNGNLSLTSTLGDVRLDTGNARVGATLDAAASVRIGTLATTSGDIRVAARGGDVTGLPDAAGFARASLATGGIGAIIVDAANGTALLGAVTAGVAGTVVASDQLVVTAQTIDITTATASNGNLALIATLDDVRIETGIAQRNATIVSAGNARIGTLATQTGNIAVTAGTDVSGLPEAAGFGRADLSSGGVGTITLAAGGALQLGTVTAGTIGQPDIADQIVATAQAIDITTATANNGNLALTATLGDVRLDTGDARIDATIDAAASARLGTLLARAGDIGVTARGGDVTGLPVGAGFGRADLTTGSGGAIVVSAANGTALLGTVSTGTRGGGAPVDQFVVTASAIDIESATASGGNLSLTSSVGDVRLATGTAQANATIAAAGSARIGTLTTLTGDIAVTAGADVSGLADVAGFGRADLTTGGLGTITLIANAGTLRLGTVTAGTIGLPDIGDQIVATAQAIDLAAATATNGALSLTSTVGDVRLDAGTTRTAATIDSAASARIGTLASAAGNIRVTARGADITGLPDAAGFGRADLATGGVGTITVGAANGTARLGTVTAGNAGTSTPVDQLIVSAQAIDIATATASNGNLMLASTLGDTRLETGAAQAGATIAASGGARIGTLATQAGNVTVTAGADVTGLSLGTGTGLASFGRADLTAGGAIALTAANGTQQLGTVTTADRIDATARAIDITTATAGTNSLSLVSTADDVRLGTGLAGTDATILANRSATIDALTTQTGKIALTATTGDVSLGTGVARTDATILAATNAAVGSLTAQTGAIAVTATSGNIAGIAATGGTFATLAAGKTIALTAEVGSATLGTVETVDGAITLTAADATLNGVIGADSATIDILRGSGSTITRIGTLPAASGGLALDDTEMSRLQADIVRIGSRIASPGTATDIAIGGLTIGTATGATALRFMASGRIALSGAIRDAGAVARTLQIGGDDAALGTTTPVATPLASRIDATVGAGGTGASIDLSAATVDLRAARIAFGNDSFVGEVASTTGTLDDAAAAQVVADDLVANAGSSLYRRNLTRDVFLRAKLLRVSYSGFALFQNTDPSLLGLGVELGLGERSVAAPAVLELRSLGDSPANSFALFGTINGFVGRVAGVLPNAVLEFVDGARNVRITQSNSRINGCVIGSPDRGCLITDAPPPLIRIFDQRQLQLFGVADDLTIPFEPSVGSSNEALIGDFTTTGGLIDPDCTVPDATGCPTQGERP